MAIEFFDELVFGVREVAWPAIRHDLGLGYAAVGVLLTVPGLVAGVLEPLFGLLGNSGKRRSIVAAGGGAFAISLVVVAHARSFIVLLGAFIVLYPASGAFVSLTQANLMDLDPVSHEKNMARWVLAGSAGVVIGPLCFVAATQFGWGWRPLFFVLALVTIPLIFRSGRPSTTATISTRAFRESAHIAWRALRNREVLRWLMMLEMTNLLGDVLTGFLALYFVDVVDVSVADAAFAIVLWSVAGLLGDALLVLLLNHVSGLKYLRASALLAVVVFPYLLLLPGLIPKLLVLAILAVLRAGWYAIPQGRLYSELQGNSGVALAVTNIAGLPASAFPLVLGVLAQHFGLGAALWCCALAPIALLVGLPPNERACNGGQPEHES